GTRPTRPQRATTGRLQASQQSIPAKHPSKASQPSSDVAFANEAGSMENRTRTTELALTRAAQPSSSRPAFLETPR
ncbi:MAG: hypothetical protein ACK53V_19625, partial [Planctomycetota bacterium]